MKKILSILPILQILSILSILPFSACVKGSGTIPGGGVDFKAIARGSIISLTSLRDSFQALASSNPKFQKNVDALNKVLVIASPINDEIQTGDGKTTAQKIEDFARLGASIAETAGLSLDIVIAINLGIGIFVSIEPFLKDGSSGSGPVAASNTGEGPAQRLGKLQALDSKYRNGAKP